MTTLNRFWMDSLVRLMSICSKPLTGMSSNPKMSRSPIVFTSEPAGSTGSSFALMMETIQSKTREYSILETASRWLLAPSTLTSAATVPSGVLMTCVVRAVLSESASTPRYAEAVLSASALPCATLEADQSPSKSTFPRYRIPLISSRIRSISSLRNPAFSIFEQRCPCSTTSSKRERSDFTASAPPRVYANLPAPPSLSASWWRMW
mmetsp:Transcript_42908/g.121400  ORF Transcript_42908/g.121400 Transcript_42908/m.121400 type:complete len:207 (+) Transcript_42908:2510-3130(+)